MTPRKPKHLLQKVGRKSDYKPEYCEQLLTHMRSGLSYEAFASQVKCSIETLYSWERLFPEFADAKKSGYAESLAFWEKIGIAGTTGKIKGFVPATWIFTMKNRFGYKEKMDPIEIDFIVSEMAEENAKSNL